MPKIEETRARIIDVAGKLFYKFGFDKTSMDEIARLSHKAKRSLYNHFPGKEDLLKAVVEKELKDAKAELQQIFEQTDLLPAERMKTYMIHRMQVMSRAETYQMILKHEFQYSLDLRFQDIEKIRKSFDQWEYHNFVVLTQLITCECVLPDFNPEAFADMTQMVLKSMDVTFFVQEKYHEYEATFRSLINLIVDSMIININQGKINIQKENNK